MRFYTYLSLIFPLFSWAQSEVDSLLIDSENQFRDSIAAINLAAEQQQFLEENFNAATDFMNNEDYINAIKSLNQVLIIDSNYTDAYFNRAVCQQKLNNYELSIADFKIVYDLDSTRSDALFEQAVYAKENNHFKQSEEIVYSDFRIVSKSRKISL